MKSHPGVNVSVRLAGVQELLGEAFPKLHVGTAAAPFPGVLGAESVGGKVFHHAVHHAFTPVDGLQLETVEFDPERLLVPSAFFVAAAGLQLAHGAGVGHCVDHTGRCDGIRKCAFPETCQRDDTRYYSGKPHSKSVFAPGIVLPLLCGEDRYHILRETTQALMFDSSTSIVLHTTSNRKTSQDKASECSAALKHPKHAHAGTMEKVWRAPASVAKHRHAHLCTGSTLSSKTWLQLTWLPLAAV